MEKMLCTLLEAAKASSAGFDYCFLDEKSKLNAQTANIKSLAFDSRAVGKGALFFALPGTHTTGNRFIAQAIKAGAVAIVFEGDIEENDAHLIEETCKSKGIQPAFIKVKSARRAMSPISACFYDNPSEHLVVYGVTGTEGKSSTVSFIWQLLRLSGFRAGFISTVQYSLGDEAVANPEHQTTPEAPIVQRKLYEMLQNGCTHAVVESSSHGLSEKLNRLGDVHFDCAAFMNVTLEHLEFHGSLDCYKNDKANLFRALDKYSHTKRLGLKADAPATKIPAFGVVNLEDAEANFFASCTSKKIFGFTTEGKAGKQAAEELSAQPLPKIKDDMPYLLARNIASARFGLSFSIEINANHDSLENEERVLHVKAGTPGAFNAYNIMAALLCVHGTCGIELSKLVPLCQKLTPITGRMTVLDEGQNFEVIVDYAHTPSSFETIFPPLRNRCTGKMICVFGSGGERDITKRPLQGKIAAHFCDTVILTDEDPRNEDRMEILLQIAGNETCGAISEGKVEGTNLFLIPDRPAAIRKAFSLAKENDIVLLLGKSHENSIIYADRVMPYDEISEAKKALKE